MPETNPGAEKTFSARDLPLILEALSTAAIVLNPAGEIVYASALAKMIPLLKAQQISDQTLQAQVERSFATRQITEQDYELTHPSAAVPWHLRIRCAPMETGYALVLFEDKTRALQADTTRREFIVNASHELKTPIGAISLLAETIHDHAEDKQAVSMFSTQLVKEARRLTKLVQEIISLARLQDGHLPVKATQVELSEIILEAIDRVQTAAGENQIAIQPELPEAAVKVQADFELLTSALQNLLENAIRYSEPNSPVKITARQTDNVEIIVADQGIGISAEDQERIFERFYRVDPARSRSTGGTGLGLSIVKHVISDLDGRIEVQSELGQGSTFTIYLPRTDRETPGDHGPALGRERFQSPRSAG